MADVETSNLYPPIINSFMPAFTGNSCKVYFELSDFNTISDINQNLIQVTLKNQINNENSLVNGSGIRYYSLQTDSNGYYITIDGSHLREGFETNIYYKVQIRFTKSGIDTSGCYTGTTDNPSMTWINSHLDYFSEWSSVCLIKKITEPTLEQNCLVKLSGNQFYECFYPILKFDGRIVFGLGENEYLTNYRLRLYKTQSSSPFTDDELIEDSLIQYPNRDTDDNRILYNFKHKLEAQERYNLYIDITTNDLYQKTEEFKGFLASFNENQNTNLTCTIAGMPDEGRIKLDITDSNPAAADYIIISRTSNRSNFELYEEIAVFPTSASLTYYDASIESGIWYKYIIQEYKKTVNNSTVTIDYKTLILDTPIIVLFEDMYMNSQDKELRLKFNSRVTSYKRAVTENKTETLGGRYPFVRRNSATNYKQFSINGLISFYTDLSDLNIFNDPGNGNSENIFTTDAELYGSSAAAALYTDYNLNNNITPNIDYIKEREFREKVLDFLTIGKVVLLRTLTEGNVLVRLMDVNVTPNQSLYNYICEFTATAVEIGECSPENYYKYGVFSYPYTTELVEG